MSIRTYMVLSFATFAVLAAVLTVNWWVSIPEEWWPLRLAFVLFGIAATACSLVMALVAAFARYREP